MIENPIHKDPIVDENKLHEALDILDLIESGTIQPTITVFKNIIDSINEANGWNIKVRDPAEWAILSVTEIVEAYEEYRNGKHQDEIYFSGDLIQKPEGIPVEHVDVLIRELHWFARNNINPIPILILKLRYNATRGFRHGGKRS